MDCWSQDHIKDEVWCKKGQPAMKILSFVIAWILVKIYVPDLFFRKGGRTRKDCFFFLDLIIVFLILADNRKWTQEGS